MLKYNNIICEKKIYLNKGISIPLKEFIEQFININKKHLNMFFNVNNNNRYLLDSYIIERILYLEIFIKNEIIITIYEIKDNIKIEIIKTKIKEIYNYTFIFMYIKNEQKNIHKVFNINEFKNMLKDIKKMVLLKSILKNNDLCITSILPKYKKPPLELFYEKYLNKKEKN